MRSKLALSTATAMAVLLGAAHAGDNESFISQFAGASNNGLTNSALVDQSGGSGNKAGSDDRKLTQTTTTSQVNNVPGMFKNTLSITQTGSANSVGLGEIANVQGNEPKQHGVFQRTNSHTLSGSTTNSLVVNQSNSGNSVGAVFQSNSSRVGTNTTSVLQGGGGSHEVVSITQRQGNSSVNATVNNIDITMTGSDNHLYRVEQYSAGANSTTNTIKATIGGTGNGHDALAGHAAATGATSSSLLQGRYVFGVAHYPATNSDIELEITGDDNSFGSSQYGDNNTVGVIAVSGDRNQVGTYQDGNDNVISIAAVGGDDNNFGIRQVGNDNDGYASVDGSGNQFAVAQIGNENDASIRLDGNDNGGTGVLTGAASIGLASGYVDQLGDNNLIDFEVTGNNNLFAFRQAGDDNEAHGTVEGNNNQVAVSQLSSGNFSFTSQVGVNNVIGVKQ